MKRIRQEFAQQTNYFGLLLLLNCCRDAQQGVLWPEFEKDLALPRIWIPPLLPIIAEQTGLQAVLVRRKPYLVSPPMLQRWRFT